MKDKQRAELPDDALDLVTGGDGAHMMAVMQEADNPLADLLVTNGPAPGGIPEYDLNPSSRIPGQPRCPFCGSCELLPVSAREFACQACGRWMDAEDAFN